MDESQLREVISANCDVDLFDLFVTNGSKDDLQRIVEAFKDKLHYKCLISAVKSGDLEKIKEAVLMLGITDHNIINTCTSQEVANLLLTLGLDLDKVDYLMSPKIEEYVFSAVGSIVFKKSFNPNRLLPNRSNIPFWHDTDFNILVKHGIPEYKGSNLSEPLDINAKDINGRTALFYKSSIGAIINYKPDTEIKDRDGLTALECRKIRCLNSDALLNYIASKDDYKEKYLELEKTHNELLAALRGIL